MQLRDVSAMTDIGRVRDSNQDSYVTLADIGIVAVADGMGGLAHGNVASETAVNTIKAAHEALGRIVAEVDEQPSARHRLQLAQGLEFLAQLQQAARVAVLQPARNMRMSGSRAASCSSTKAIPARAHRRSSVLWRPASHM